MKKILPLLVLFLILSGLVLFIYQHRDRYEAFFESLNPCGKPILYRVEDVDKGFNITRDEFIKSTKEAASIWNKAYGRELFAYSDSGSLSVNMIFDERQQATNKINSLDKKLGSEKDKLDAQIKKYRQDVDSFKKKLSEHNSRVDFWNSQGGAPPDEYEKLNQNQATLQKEADSLNGQAKNLNLSSEDYNLQVGSLNKAITDFNESLETKPEEGIFMGDLNRIEIYFNNNKQELTHTLAHELGHARSLVHNNDPKSIMFSYSTKVVDPSSMDLADLNEVCRERSAIEVLRSRFNY